MVGKVELEELHEFKASQKLEAGTLVALNHTATVLGTARISYLITPVKECRKGRQPNRSGHGRGARALQIQAVLSALVVITQSVTMRTCEP